MGSKFLRYLLPAAFAGSFALGFASCDEADKLFDCESVCSRYKDCFDSGYDVGKCRSTCKDKADADKTWQQKADNCESCISGKSCTAGAFACGVECAGIVP